MYYNPNNIHQLKTKKTGSLTFLPTGSLKTLFPYPTLSSMVQSSSSTYILNLIRLSLSILMKRIISFEGQPVKLNFTFQFARRKKKTEKDISQ